MYIFNLNYCNLLMLRVCIDEHAYQIHIKKKKTFQVSRIFSCSLNETQNDWTSILLFNQTNFEISDLVLNAQYTIEIIISDKDKNNTYYKKTVYTLTPPSSKILNTQYHLQNSYKKIIVLIFI